MYLEIIGNERSSAAALLDWGISMWWCLRPVFDGKVEEGDNDKQWEMPRYATRQLACSGHTGKPLKQGSSYGSRQESRIAFSPTEGKLLGYDGGGITE
jgi:hypothetical protein